jgi:hypothetical protein
MSGRPHRGYTLRTSRGTGSYRSWERAVGAARWTAEVTMADTSIVNDDSGEMWDVKPDGRVSVYST